jgi:hypothetical protein
LITSLQALSATGNMINMTTVGDYVFNCERALLTVENMIGEITTERNLS